MLRTTTYLRLGILASRSQQSCVWHPKADSPERCSMRTAGPARTLFKSLRWDCLFWALTWLRPHWRSPERRPTTVGSRLSSLRLTHSILERLGRRFETVLDCGLFHTFDADERPRYVASLASVTEHDATLYVLCFSDDGPDTGPHPISQEELESGVQPQHWMECRRHRTGPDSDEIPRRRRTGLVRNNQTDIDRGAGRSVGCG
jgi:hypothetical protein